MALNKLNDLRHQVIDSTDEFSRLNDDGFALAAVGASTNNGVAVTIA